MSRPRAPLSEVIVTGQLMKRPERPILSTFTNAVMAELDRLLLEQPQGFLAEAARAALILPGGHSAGLSLCGGDGACAARAVEGRWAKHPGSAALLDRWLCPLALERRELLLVSRPERALPELEALYPRIEEALLAPFFHQGRDGDHGDRPAGVVWAVFHDAQLRFDIHDGYMLQELARLLQAAFAHPGLRLLLS
jgi:hypothetical protein